MINGIFSYINLIHCKWEWIGVGKSVPFFWPNPSIRKYFCSNLKPQPHPETEKQKLKSKLVSVTAIVNMAQTAKKATCLTTITQYNSTSSLTPEAPSTRIRIFSKTEIFFLHLPSTRKQHFRPQIWRFLKTLSRLDIYRILVDADSF